MRGSLFLGRYFNIKVFVHWTFLLLILWVVISDTRQGQDWQTIGWHILFILILFLCVTLHEFGHALVAKYFNYNTRDITLLPIGGLARLEEIPEKPSQELLVAIAGPIVNFVIAGLIYILLRFGGGFPDIEGIESIDAANFWFMLMAANLFIGIFNLIPAFPMDGGRILRALLGYKFPYHVATQVAVMVGQFIAVLFVLFGLLYNPFLVIIGIVIYFGAQAEVSFARTKYLLKGYRVKDLLMHHYLTLNRHDTIGKAVSILLDGQAKDFLVLDDEQKVSGTLNRNEVIEALSNYDESMEVWKVMNSEVNSLNPEMKISDVLLKNRAVPSLMPVLQNGELLGVIDLENIMEFVKIHEAMEKR